MRITLITVGKLKESFWREAVEEYSKRLTAYCDMRQIEIADRDPARLGDERVLVEEGSDILRAIPEGSYVIALDIKGKTRTSEDFSAHLGELGLSGKSNVTFIIGGSIGLAAEVLQRADERFSFGSMTLPHNLARVVLVEQLYRAFRIARNEPYHK